MYVPRFTQLTGPAAAGNYGTARAADTGGGERYERHTQREDQAEEAGADEETRALSQAESAKFIPCSMWV